MNTFIASLIRTVVPIIIGALGAWLTKLGLNLDSAAYENLGIWLTLLFSSVYYALVRLLEEKFPQIGWFLGLAASPDSYSKGPGVELTTKPDGNPEITVNIQGTDSKADEATVYVNRLTDGPDHRKED
jgi:hypothetical protein